jgi:GT2 family glycosyltransferase
MTGVSIVIPVHNGERWIRDVVEAVRAQAGGRPLEVLLIDDHSTDRSSDVLQRLATHPDVRIVKGLGRGAAAAINAGIRTARHPLIAQIDQDVVVQSNWIERLSGGFSDPAIGAMQGYYISAPDAGLFGRVMNLDLEQRYARIGDTETDHVCTGNTIYRADALQRIGLFDETLGYGYDNDVSYRLRDAGYRLRIDRSARAVHRWREGIGEYLTQQYGFGYGRIDLVAKHPHRAGGDAVSPFVMMVHPIALFAALVCGAVAFAAAAFGQAPHWWATIAVAITVGLLGERGYAGVSAALRFRRPAALAFPFVHLLRDLAWVAAIAVWMYRRLTRRPLRPSDSMTPRGAYRVNRADSAPAPKRPRA